MYNSGEHLTVLLENQKGSWSIEIKDGHTVVYREPIKAILGLALSALAAFERCDRSTSQHNWWQAQRNEDAAGYD